MPIWGNKTSMYKKAEKSNAMNAMARAWEEYERYRAMSYQEADNIFKAAQCVLEVKGILSNETVGISELELSNLITEAKRVGDLAESCQVLLSARKKSRLLYNE